MTKPAPVYVLGGAQTDFARNWSKEGKHFVAAMREATLGALEATRIEPREVETAHVGNFAAELYARQGHIGAFFLEIDPAFSGLPTSRHEAACASGSIALIAASADIEAARYDLACVVGVEQMKTVDSRIDGLHLFDADHAGQVVARGFDVGRRRDQRDRARRAGRFMTAGRQPGESGIDLEEKCADMALPGVQLGGEVADVSSFNFARFDAGSFERAQSCLAHRGHEMLAFFRPIAGKVGLRSAQHVHRRWFHHRALLSAIQSNHPTKVRPYSSMPPENILAPLAAACSTTAGTVRFSFCSIATVFFAPSKSTMAVGGAQLKPYDMIVSTSAELAATSPTRLSA